MLIFKLDFFLLLSPLCPLCVVDLLSDGEFVKLSPLCSLPSYLTVFLCWAEVSQIEIIPPVHVCFCFLNFMDLSWKSIPHINVMNPFSVCSVCDSVSYTYAFDLFGVDGSLCSVRDRGQVRFADVRTSRLTYVYTSSFQDRALKRLPYAQDCHVFEENHLAIY